MTRTRVVVNTSLFFLVAIAFGCLEGSGMITWGPPDLWVFHARWHIPMAVIFLTVAYLSGCLVHFPAAIIFEDATYWVASRLLWHGPELAPDSWVSMSLGGFTDLGAYIPWMYVILLGVWGISLFSFWAYRELSAMHE
jgi:hypothetical protein